MSGCRGSRCKKFYTVGGRSGRETECQTSEGPRGIFCLESVGTRSDWGPLVLELDVPVGPSGFFNSLDRE